MTRFFAVTSSKQHELELHNPALCDELRIRDILDHVVVMTSGAFVAAYELSGVHSFYHTEDMRNRAKESFEAVLRSMPERSMRLHLRFEIRHDTGGVIRQYADCARNSSMVLGSIDAERCSRWLEKEAAGEFLDHVVDCFKVSGMHLAVLIGWFRYYDLSHAGYLLIPMCFTLVSAAFFFSVILSEQLRRGHTAKVLGSGSKEGRAPVLRSVFVLPWDYGVLCLTFALWSIHVAFGVVYSALLMANVVLLAVALGNWYRELSRLATRS